MKINGQEFPEETRASIVEVLDRHRTDPELDKIEINGLIVLPQQIGALRSALVGGESEIVLPEVEENEAEILLVAAACLGEILGAAGFTPEQVQTKEELIRASRAVVERL